MYQIGARNFRAPEVEVFRTNLYEAKTPVLGKGGVAAPSRKMARRHLVWRGRGGSSKLPLESIRRLNEPPRLRPAKGLRDISLMGAATPPSPRRGIPAHSVFLVCCKLSGEILTHSGFFVQSRNEGNTTAQTAGYAAAIHPSGTATAPPPSGKAIAAWEGQWFRRLDRRYLPL